MVKAIVGQIMYWLAAVHPVPHGYMEADGRCLTIGLYPQLAEALHDGDNWPYGTCGEGTFRLPNLKSKDEHTTMIIKVF